jgi:hypothetical protein
MDVIGQTIGQTICPSFVLVNWKIAAIVFASVIEIILIYFMYFIPLHSFTIANETIKENLKKTVPTGQDTLRKNQKM